ncbi:hypothetical protein RRG08_003415 [Elysia crispata]|uniref:Uncharacterized protein n=1 Tax=Elysia crispata TaxID=231223 RepID=A0AAE1DVU7_9GAST|nr:hypothetical protein RRG08_003415 [Elysia crispata]
MIVSVAKFVVSEQSGAVKAKGVETGSSLIYSGKVVVNNIPRLEATMRLASQTLRLQNVDTGKSKAETDPATLSDTFCQPRATWATFLSVDTPNCS